MLFHKLNISIITLLACGASHGAEFHGATFGDTLTINDTQTIIEPGAIIYANDIHMMTSGYIDNNGQIYGTMHLCDGCDTFIRNHGTINGTVYIPDTGTLTQIITDTHDINPIDTYGNVHVMINSTSNLNWSTIKSMSQNATKIILDNANIIINHNDMATLPRAYSPEIELIGHNTITATGITGTSDTYLLNGVTGTGTISVNVANSNPLFVAMPVLNDGVLYLHFMRETDYEKIFTDGVGTFLNSIRREKPNDKLIMAMDAAQTYDELHDIMSHSIRFNPRRLTAPTKTINRAMQSYGPDIRRHTEPMHPNFYATPFAITGNDISSYGTRIGIMTDITDKFRIAGDAYAGIIKYSATMDNADGETYSFNMRAQYMSHRAFAIINAGVGRTEWDTDNIYDNGKILHQINNRHTFVDTSIGPITSMGNIQIIPFAGAGIHHDKILNDSDIDITAHGGATISTAHETTGITYNYGARTYITTDNTINADAHVEITSEMDNAGGTISAGITRDDFTTSYMFTIGLHVGF